MASEAQDFLAGDPFEGPEEDGRARPYVTAAYDGECGVCFTEFYEGEEIRALPGGDGWEARDHGHEYDPVTLLPSAPLPVPQVGQRTLLPSHAPYAVPDRKDIVNELPESLIEPPTDAELYAAMGSGHPEVEAEASDLLGMSTEERRAYLNPQDPEEDHLYEPAQPAQFTCRECGKSFAPTKDRRVRKHNGRGREVCPGSRSVPEELTAPGDAVVQRAAHSAVPVLVPGPGSALAGAVAASPQVAAIVDRINSGRAGMLAAPPEDAPDAAHAAYEKQLDDLSVPPVEGDDEGGQDCGGCGRRTFNNNGRCDACNEAGRDPAAEAEAFAAGMTALFPPTVPAPWSPEQDAHLFVPRPPEPEPDRDSYGRYLLPHPQTGQTLSWRRATTFAGVLDDTYNLDLWQKRHLLRGAAMAATEDPGELTPYAKLDIAADKDMLNSRAQELAERSGVNEAADQGTLVHALTEAVDRGEPGAWDAVPAQYRADVQAYLKALSEAGFRVVPSMLERRTLVLGYGRQFRSTGAGVAGTFDQVLQTVRDIPAAGLKAGEFVVGDRKTGKDMSFGELAHAIQLCLYADGLNSSGVWDGHAGRWEQPLRVSDRVGVIIHLPLEKGECTLHLLNLTEGRAACKDVQAVYDRRTRAKAKATGMSRVLHTAAVPRVLDFPKTAPPVAPQPAQQTGVDWRSLVRAVRTVQDASALWQRAQASGMDTGLLAQLTEAMQRALAAEQAQAAAPTEQDWVRAAVSVTSQQDAAKVYEDMAAWGVAADVVELVVQRMRDRLASLEQAQRMTAAPVPSLEDRAGLVLLPEHASALFQEAQQTPGMTRERLDVLVAVMQAALAAEPPF